jgi:probable lipoprotein NlpC
MRFWFMLAAALILAGCSSHRAPPPNPRLADSITVVANLNEQLRSWRGAPYRYGGMTPRGVDCSGFVVRTFRDKFAPPPAGFQNCSAPDNRSGCR